MLSGLEPSFMWDASLSFPLGPPVYVCATLLCGQEGHVHCRVTGCWVCSPGPLSPLSSSSEALDEIELLDSCQLAVWAVRLRLWQPWHTFRTSLNWTDVAWYSRFVTINVNSQFRYFAGLQQPWPLAWSTHATTHTDCQMITGKKNKLYATLDLNSAQSLRNEMQYFRALNGALWSKGWQIKFCLLHPVTILSQ